MATTSAKMLQMGAFVKDPPAYNLPIRRYNRSFRATNLSSVSLLPLAYQEEHIKQMEVDIARLESSMESRQEEIGTELQTGLCRSETERLERIPRELNKLKVAGSLKPVAQNTLGAGSGVCKCLLTTAFPASRIGLQLPLGDCGTFSCGCDLHLKYTYRDISELTLSWIVRAHWV